MKRSYRDYLQDIQEYMEKAQSFIEGMDYAGFVADDKTNFAVVRSLEVVGEATKHIPDEVRIRFPDVPWSDMAGMRDKMIHAYVGVDLRVVWDTVTLEVFRVLPAVQSALQVLEAEEGSD